MLALCAECQTTSHVQWTRDQVCRTSGKVTFRLENKTAFKLVIQVVSLKGSARIPTLLKMERGCQLCSLLGHPARKALDTATGALRGQLVAQWGGILAARIVWSYKGSQLFPKHCLFWKKLRVLEMGNTRENRRWGGRIHWVISVTRRKERPEVWIKTSLVHVGCCRFIKSK